VGGLMMKKASRNGRRSRNLCRSAMILPRRGEESSQGKERGKVLSGGWEPMTRTRGGETMQSEGKGRLQRKAWSRSLGKKL